MFRLVAHLLGLTLDLAVDQPTVPSSLALMLSTQPTLGLPNSYANVGRIAHANKGPIELPLAAGAPRHSTRSCQISSQWKDYICNSI